MPNYVINKIRFDCGEEKLQEILAAIQAEPDGERESFGPGTIDFDKLIPMPESLNIESGSSTDHGIELYLTSVNPLAEGFGTDKMDADSFSDLLGKLNRSRMFGSYRSSLSNGEISEISKHESVEKLIDLGRQAVSNLLEYGAATWYEWRNRHWNTKWNACDCQYDGDNTIEFQTAWSAPHPILEELTARFPGVYITHQWADEDIGSGCGQLEYLNGECVGDLTPESDTDALEFAVDLWGYTPEDYDLTINAAHTRYIDSENETFEVVEFLDKPMLFSNARLTDEDIPDGLYHYDLRMTDDGERFGTLEPFAVVNHGGTVVTDEPIDFGEKDCIELSEDNALDFTGKELSFGRYLRGDYTLDEQEDMKLE